MMRRSLFATTGIAVVMSLATGCSKPEASSKPATSNTPPNILWVVWDTARADHLSTYGYAKTTTPKLDAWSRNARVFEDCLSVAPHTIPSHASMFTGLLPTEHGCNNDSKALRDSYRTLPELLHKHGYRTYLYSANPHISEAENYHRGFDVHEYPWQKKYHDEAYRIVKEKLLPQDKSSELPNKYRQADVNYWDIKASGELAQRGVLEWLNASNPNQPYFIFLNYMEAHSPYIPPEQYRRRVMTDQQVVRSYEVDRSWVTGWCYTFGLHEFTDEELGVLAGSYDACLAELDDLFADLLAALESRGHLKNTIVILTSDHGENLGDHHMTDHQFALYHSLLHVPLIVHYPAKFVPGRDRRPVSTIDIFPTLLELANIPAPVGKSDTAVSLLSPVEDRPRPAEYPAPFEDAFRAVRQVHKNWEPGPDWRQSLKSLTTGPHKYIQASDGRDELYNLKEDPGEQRNLDAQDPRRVMQMAYSLLQIYARVPIAKPALQPARPQTDEQKELLRAVGYLLDQPETQPAFPTSRPGIEAVR